MSGPTIFLALLIVAVTITLYFLIRSKHIENMTRIEHGMTQDDQNGGLRLILNLGIFLCFLGGGFLLAYLISTYTKVPEYIAMPTCLLFAGGIGLILSYLINTTMSK